jgi:hypothetical protein
MAPTSAASVLPPVAVDHPASTVIGYVLGDVLLGRGREGFLDVDGRTEDGIDVVQRIPLRAADFNPPLLPRVLIKALGADDRALHARLAVSGSLHWHPSRLEAVAVQWALEPLYQRRGDGVPAAAIDAVLEKIDAAEFRPAAVILGGLPTGGRFSITCLFAIDEPILVATEAERTAATDLLARLAARLGADVPEPVERFTVPIPSARIRGIGRNGEYRVAALRLDDQARIPTAALIAALS